mmetsp:Transcript_22826/g.40632  ORF Transcript_22826/g.40632 Transcript_22826/m.40632 type:complete len:436 (+) Transcript_22826:244-1551(+)
MTIRVPQPLIRSQRGGIISQFFLQLWANVSPGDALLPLRRLSGTDARRAPAAALPGLTPPKAAPPLVCKRQKRLLRVHIAVRWLIHVASAGQAPPLVRHLLRPELPWRPGAEVGDAAGRTVPVAVPRLRHGVRDILLAAGCLGRAALADGVLENAGVRKHKTAQKLVEEASDERELGGVARVLALPWGVVVVVVVRHVSLPGADKAVHTHAVAELQSEADAKVAVARVLHLFRHYAVVKRGVDGVQFHAREEPSEIGKVGHHLLRCDVLQHHLVLRLRKPKVLAVHEPDGRLAPHVRLHPARERTVEANNRVVRVNLLPKQPVPHYPRARHHRARAVVRPFKRVRLRQHAPKVLCHLPHRPHPRHDLAPHFVYLLVHDGQPFPPLVARRRVALGLQRVSGRHRLQLDGWELGERGVGAPAQLMRHVVLVQEVTVV